MTIKASIHTVNRHPVSPKLARVAQLRSDGVHRQEFAAKGPVILKLVRVTGATFSGIMMDPFLCASLLPHPLLVRSGHLRYKNYRRHPEI